MFHLNFLFFFFIGLLVQWEDKVYFPFNKKLLKIDERFSDKIKFQILQEIKLTEYSKTVNR